MLAYTSCGLWLVGASTITSSSSSVTVNSCSLVKETTDYRLGILWALELDQLEVNRTWTVAVLGRHQAIRSQDAFGKTKPLTISLFCRLLQVITAHSTNCVTLMLLFENTWQGPLTCTKPTLCSDNNQRIVWKFAVIILHEVLPQRWIGNQDAVFFGTWWYFISFWCPLAKLNVKSQRMVHWHLSNRRDSRG